MTESKLRVGIIGIGSYAAGTHVPNLRATGRADVVAAARRNPEHLALAQRELDIPAVYTDWRKMLAEEELDAVVVSTPHNLHRDPTLAALARGLHVLLEKPLATTVADAQAILQATDASDRVVMMGVNRRGDPSWRTIQELLVTGEIGQVRQINAVLCTDLRTSRQDIPWASSVQEWINSSPIHRAFTSELLEPDSWRNDPSQMGGDMFADIGAHLVDVLLWMGGAPVAEVLAYSPGNKPPRGAILSVQALLANDLIVSIVFNDNVALGDEFSFQTRGRITAFGDRGIMTAEIPYFGAGPAEGIMLERNGAKHAVAVEGATISTAAAFIASVLDGAPNIAPVADAANVVALIQGAYRSAAEHRIVRMDEAI